MDKNVDFISEQVLDYLKTHCDYDSSLRLYSPVQTLVKDWSIIYFISLNEKGQKQDIVVKVSRFRDQIRSEESWEEEHLIDRGVREYDGLVRIYDHFQAQGNDMLQTVRPIAFIRDINGIVMDFFDGDSYYQTCLSPKKILKPGVTKRAGVLAHRTGEWLRHFHDLSLEMQDIPCEEDRLYSPQRTFQLIQNVIERLQEQGIDPTKWANWSKIEAAYSQLDSDERVWIHSDFHMGNAMVLAGDQILSFDTGLDKKDHPYEDAGKFLADIQSRGVRTLSFGLIPPTAITEALRQKFLDGYLQGRTLDKPIMALYEGLYLFEKWEESIAALEAKSFSKKLPAPLRQLIIERVLNPTFKQIINYRLEKDLLR